MKLEGAVFVVCGGASGLGEATVRMARVRGAQVAILDVDSDRGASVAAETGALFVRADVSSSEEVQAAFDQVEQRLGVARVLVNCAGVAHGERTLKRDGMHSLASFEQVVRVNLVGTFNALRIAAARMSKLALDDDGSRGVIVNTASAAAFEGQAGQAAYAASKGAVAAMTLPLARDLAKSAIRVMTIAPGLFDTPMLASLPEAVRASLSEQVPHPSRLGDPREFASLVMQIVENEMLNGETIRLDGALRMTAK